ncbi:MAG: hypothetical protein IAG13_10995 [Deltaproteobacteria bacterium]|nr:hypothetical protein [Nannocystaceae bacterium]
MPMPPPEDPTFGSSTSTATTGSTSDSGSSDSTTGSAAVPCGPELDACAADSFCSAPVIGTTPMPGEFLCGACLEPDDPLRWCLDAASCCDPSAICDNGFCLGEAIATESSSSSTSSGATSSGEASSDSTGA